MAKRPHGFTLVELLVVIAIIALLLSILMPALNRVRQMARQTICLSNERSLTQASLTYTNDCSGKLPLAGVRNSQNALTPDGWPYAPYWDVRIVPYLGAKSFNPYSLGTNITFPDPAMLAKLKPYASYFKVFICPVQLATAPQGIKDVLAMGWYPRNYRLNSQISGCPIGSDGNWNLREPYTDSTSVTAIRQPGRVLLFVDTAVQGNSAVNAVWGWGARGWTDAYPIHFVKILNKTKRWPWYLPFAKGRSSFSFVDGHVESMKTQFTVNDETYVYNQANIKFADPIPGVRFSASDSW
jgi:prepilin-type N-terminal cleavage/methylation domain-containing protein/prepilin-type processing-associated H-X9-DG protein